LNSFVPFFSSEIDFNEIKGLKFCSLNVNGLHHKFEEVKLFLQTYNFHCLTLTELRLSKDFIPSAYFIPNYTFIPCITNANKSRGGTAFYIRNDCTFNEVVHSTKFPDFTEISVMEVKIPFIRKMLAINVYRSPAVKSFDFFDTSLISLHLLMRLSISRLSACILSI